MTVFLRVILKPHFACFCLAGEDHGIEEKANGKVMVRNHHWTCHFTDLLHSVSLCSLHHWVQPGHLYHIWIFKADFHISTLLVKLSVWTVHTLWCKIYNRIFKMDVAKLWLSSISMFRSFFFFFSFSLFYAFWAILEESRVHLSICTEVITSLFLSFLSYYWCLFEKFSGKIADLMSFILKNKQYFLQRLHVFVTYTNTAGPKGIILESHLWQVNILFLLHMHTISILWRFYNSNPQRINLFVLCCLIDLCFACSSNISATASILPHLFCYWIKYPMANLCLIHIVASAWLYKLSHGDIHSY